ncbi:MAG: YSC84-related protein [Acidobacteriota bacterium]|nr:YSC84-related protein [Acidobacteriota bacterium]
MTKRLFASAVVLAFAFASTGLPAKEVDKPSKRELKRQAIDQVAVDTMTRLFDERPKSHDLYRQCYGYAVFDNLKISLGITGGGGVGVAVIRGTDNKTYMKMATGGLNLGLGGQTYQVVFVFQDQRTYENFVEKGWQAEAGANAVAGKRGANAEASFTQGLAVFQLTSAGAMLQADISGTKYWKHKKLNRY